MIKVKFNTKVLEQQMKGLLDYSAGFLEGAQRGKTLFLQNLGKGTIIALYRYIDTNARMNPQALQHVYEWYQVGSPSARLFDITSIVSGKGLSINATFSQSKLVQSGSTVPFYNKAKVMESGNTVTIRPRPGGVLVFDDNGKKIFTKNPVVNKNPGGAEAQNGFEKTFDSFMNLYFAQSFLSASGIYEYISNPIIYKTDLKTGIKVGRSAGISAGFKWMANAKIEVE